MHRTLYLNKKVIKLSSSDLIGSGGEADIFKARNGLVYKIFEQPDHPDFSSAEKDVVRYRLAEYQKKLVSFPKLTNRVISPIDFIKDKNASICGYSMRFLKGYDVILKYSDKHYRQSGIKDRTVVQTFKDLYKTVVDIHDNNVVIGDFNDLNILVKDSEAYFIDADSFQFDNFYCRVFTEKFVDPLLCDNKQQHLALIGQHNKDSDWYAFAIMLMQSLIFVGPYGGIYKPSNKSNRIPHSARPLKRINIFNKEVKYPKPATKYEVLPDDLLHHFYQVFTEDRRGRFPEKLLDINWTTCPKCGSVHAKDVCPNCAHYIPSSVVETIRGNVVSKRVFSTSGMIVLATTQGGRLRYIYYNNKEFIRENNNVITKGDIKPSIRFRIRRQDTIIGNSDRLFLFSADSSVSKMAIDSAGTLPLFDSNSRYLYWINDGKLMRNDTLGSKYIGDVLTNRTLFWVGEDFGFGVYKAGHLAVSFVFNAERSGINDSVKLPHIVGQIIDSVCYFSGSWCWFLLSIRDKGIGINKCIIIKSDGSVHQSAEAKEGDGSWLGSIRGKCAVGGFLLSPTDDGVVRVEPKGSTLSVVKTFPDTEPFVDLGNHLLAG